MMSRQRTYQLNRISEGLCSICGREILFKGERCSRCYMEQIFRSRYINRKKTNSMPRTISGRGRPYVLELEEG